MWQKSKLYLLLLVVLFCSPLAYSQEAEPITAQELQGLPESVLIEIILTYDQNLTATDQDLKTTNEAWTTAEAILAKDEQRAKEREAEAKRLAGLFETSLKLREQEKAEILINNILIGSGSAIVASAITIIILQFSQ